MTSRFDPQPMMDCRTCGFLSCICAAKRDHKEDCKYLKAVRCPVAIECSHDRSVCPTCDPCTCGSVGFYGRHVAAPGEVPDK